MIPGAEDSSMQSREESFVAFMDLGSRILQTGCQWDSRSSKKNLRFGFSWFFRPWKISQVSNIEQLRVCLKAGEARAVSPGATQDVWTSGTARKRTNESTRCPRRIVVGRRIRRIPALFPLSQHGRERIENRPDWKLIHPLIPRIQYSEHTERLPRT